MAIRHLYEFGPFRLDPEERQIFCNEKPLALTPKSFDLLVLLVENSGHLLGKDQILERVWPDQFVEESNLSFNISVLRKALGENGKGQSYIETVPKKGFRFIGRVERIPVERGAEVKDRDQTFPDSGVKTPITHPFESDRKTGVPIAPKPVVRPFPRFVVLVGILTTISLIAIAYVLWKNRSEAARERPFKTVAVLPFKPLITDSRDESLEMGMAETIITRLSRISQIVVRPMNAVRKYTDLQQDPAQAGRELQVDAVLDGSIQKTDNHVRVTVRLLDVQTGATLWTDQFDEDFTHIFKVQDSISERVTKALKLRLSGEEQTNVAKRYTDDAEAYQLYLQGKYLWSMRRPEELLKSLEHFQRATDKDPNFALAYIGIAESHLSLLGSTRLPAHEAIPKAVAAMTKALELDPKLAEAHNTLAEIKYQFEYDWPGAEREFKHAIELNPNTAFIHLAYGWYLMMASRFEEARAEMDRAQELDPSSLIINRARGRLFYFSRQFDQAIQHYQKILEVEPDLGINHRILGNVYLQKGMYAEAVEEFSRAARLDSQLKPDQLERIEVLRNAFAVSGRQAYLEKVTADFEEKAKTAYVAPHLIALLYAQQGKNDQAFAWLEKALESRDPAIVTLKIEPLFDDLRSDPRYSALLRRMNMI